MLLSIYPKRLKSISLCLQYNVSVLANDRAIYYYIRLFIFPLLRNRNLVFLAVSVVFSRLLLFYINTICPLEISVGNQG